MTGLIKVFLLLGYFNNLSLEEHELNEIDWVARNVYFEARQEDATRVQRRHVAEVMYNRLKTGIWGSSYKAIVTYPYNCEFSWYCDGASDKISDYIYTKNGDENVQEFHSAVKSYVIARQLLVAEGTSIDALYYHASSIDTPGFFKTIEFLFDDGLHKFYR